jgi:hypothetical protein
MAEFVLTREIAEKVLSVVDAGLVFGLGKPVPGSMCVEAAVCYALGMAHDDDPRCVNKHIRSVKINLNDSEWSSDKARAKGLRKLSILQLGTKTAFNAERFANRIALMMVNDLLPLAYDSMVGFEKEAIVARKIKSVAAAKTFIVNSPVYYEDEDIDGKKVHENYDDVVYYARRTVDHVGSLNDCAQAVGNVIGDMDKALTVACDGIAKILIDMNVPGVAYLDLIQ